MRAFLFVFIAALVGTACDCNGGEEVEPSDAQASDLYGWWTVTEPDGTLTVFGFVPRADAPRELPVTAAEATGDISAVYRGSRGFLAEPVQLATFTVEDGEVLQTVIRDASATAGTQFRTRILALTRQRTLTLQSANAASGSRAFSWSARCPAALSHGYFEVPGQFCNAYFSSATSMVVDVRGGVHAASSVNGKEPPCAVGRLPVPTYSHFASACGPTLTQLPAFRSSAMASEGDFVHLAYQSLSSNLPEDFLLFYRTRELRGTWSEEQVAGQGHPIHQMRVLMRRGQPLILVSRTNGVIELYSRDTGSWSLVPTLLTTGGPLQGQMADATVDPAGRLVLLLEANHKLAYERAGGFELIDLPLAMATGFGGGVAVDTSGQVHVAYVYDEIGDNADGVGGRVVGGRGLYALYDGRTWTSHEAGPMAYPRLITRPEGPWRVVHALDKAARPALALTEVGRDGSLRSELITVESSFGPGNSPEPFHQFAAAMGPEGTIAATFMGNRLFIRPREDEIVREKTKLTVTIEGRGGGRVRSGDGTIDCTSTCTVDVPQGARYQLFFEPDGQSALDAFPCPTNIHALYGYCWYDVFPGLAQAPQFTVKFRQSPVASVLRVGAEDGSTTVRRLVAREGRLAVAASTTNGRFPFAGQVVNVGTATELLAVRETDGRVWAAPLPAVPDAVGLRADGTASALFFDNRGLSFPSGPAGSQTAPALVLAHYANGSFLRLERLAQLPQGTAVSAGAVGDDEAAGAVLYNGSGFGAVGVPELSLFVYRQPTGNVVLRGLDTQALAGSTNITLDSGNAAVSALTKLFTFTAGAPTGTREVANGQLQHFVLRGNQLDSSWSSFQGVLDFGGGPVRGQQSPAYFHAEHGLDLRLISASAVVRPELQYGPGSIFPGPSGPVFLTNTFRGGLQYGSLRDQGYLFTYAGDLAGNKAQPFLSDLDGNSLWVAVQNRGTVDYDVTRISSPFQTVLVQLRIP
ncbi:hypothetical protein [Hyalangium gracile]|uniref:hypothetical protein n=1 Tax=Hyalangium gracile TaxID=394092 RepID=UPI001CCF2B54|nr:hypothetical protein [Hyalangium gracile]